MTTLDQEAPRARAQLAAAAPSARERYFDFEQGISIRAVIAISVLAGLLARGLAPALPGLAVGMESFIAVASRLAAVLSMVAVAGALSASARLTARLFGDIDIDVPYRVIVVPAGICASMLAVAAVFRSLNAELNLVLAFASAGPVLVAAPLLLRRVETRAAGLVFVLTGAAGLVHVLGRAVAVHAADEANVSVFRLAQWTETLASLVDIATIGLVAAYVVARSSQRARVALGVCALLGLALAVVATRGTEPESPWWQVLAGRVLDQFLRNPDPFLPGLLRYVIEVATLFFVAVTLVLKRQLGQIGVLLAACLAGRAAADIPIPALLLLLAALLAPQAVAAATAGRPSSARADDQRPENDHEIGHGSEK